ncbi:MAG: acyltransferase family protein [Blastococcus sp.]
MSAPGAGSIPASAPARPRSVYLDNLKVVLIAAIIAGHAVAGYSDVGDVWAYTNVREVTLSAATTLLLLVLLVPFVLFLIALLFLVAGLLTPGSYDRKGPARFTRDRLLRLGLPYAAFTLVIAPALEYALYRPLGFHKGSYWTEFVRDFPVASVLWFVAVLLVLSLGYAGWRRLRPPATVSRPLTAPVLLLVAAAVGVATFPIRMAFPYGSYGIWGLHVWQWPECAALFGIGVVAARQRWLTAVPDRLRRQARIATLAAAVTLAVLILLPLGHPMEEWTGGPRWTALVFALIEGVLTVFGPIWMLAVAQRRLSHPFRHGAALARSSYGAFLVQAVFLYGFAVALRPVPVPAEVKALVVAVLSVAGSFALSWLLITRVPLLRRIL